MQTSTSGQDTGLKVSAYEARPGPASEFIWWENQKVLTLPDQVNGKIILQNASQEDLKNLLETFEKAYRERYSKPTQVFYLAASFLHFLPEARDNLPIGENNQNRDLYNKIISLAERLKSQTRLALPDVKVQEIECAIVCRTWLLDLKKLLAYQLTLNALLYSRYYYLWRDTESRRKIIWGSVLLPPLWPVLAVFFWWNPVRRYSLQMKEIQGFYNQSGDQFLSKNELLKRIQDGRESLHKKGCEPPWMEKDLKEYLQVLESWLETYLLENELIPEHGLEPFQEGSA